MARRIARNTRSVAVQTPSKLPNRHQVAMMVVADLQTDRRTWMVILLAKQES